MKTTAIREALAFMRRAGIDGSIGFVLAEAEQELAAIDGTTPSSIRDGFAAAALTGHIAHSGQPRKTSMDGPDEAEQRRVAALHAYRWADAMMKARQG